MPCSKTHFADEKTALEYVKRLQETSKRQVVPHRAYLCEKCLNWHITSLPLKKEKTIKDQLHQLEMKLKEKNGRIKNLEKKVDSLQGLVADANRKNDAYLKIIRELEQQTPKNTNND